MGGFEVDTLSHPSLPITQLEVGIPAISHNTSSKRYPMRRKFRCGASNLGYRRAKYHRQNGPIPSPSLSAGVKSLWIVEFLSLSFFSFFFLFFLVLLERRSRVCLHYARGPRLVVGQSPLCTHVFCRCPSGMAPKPCNSHLGIRYALSIYVPLYPGHLGRLYRHVPRYIISTDQAARAIDQSASLLPNGCPTLCRGWSTYPKSNNIRTFSASGLSY
ncbi:uncharacterized protein LY79DRAFT_31914 [Colletotrichum navitas]|uniref:Uncharacterized protein n=1 Tax=Colletotrichum navitas TaxID=681940 RepID=A0AAD8Q6H6_9PEZI|nr:uncharacterized protein LY79DRAFT_31914 [Colletotrichum navitas]KAK1596806.1 hypothetical protein LY79DRAFT_31914 [Colletotrichum navitas]